jgi:hypothetical protein
MVPSARQLEPVPVFEPVHEAAGSVVVARHRTGALEYRRVGDGGRREQRHAEVNLERRPEPLAERALDKAHLAPAPRT